jgi:hypothetical protein
LLPQEIAPRVLLSFPDLTTPILYRYFANKNMRLTLPLFLLMLGSVTLVSCFPKVTAPPKPFQPPFMVIGAIDSLIPATAGGVSYMLPKTRFDVTLHVKKTELVKGPFAAYAGKYLGIDNVISTNASYWQIEEIEIRSTPVPDTDHLYYVAMGEMDSSCIPLAFQMNFSNIGMLTGASPMDDSRTFENTSITPSNLGYSNVFKYYSENNLFETADTIVEKVLMDSVTVEKTVIKKKMVEKPLEQRAKETADLILKLKDQRLSLLTGYHEVPYDPVTMKFMADELEKMEREYIELFTGITIQSKYRRSFTYTPTPADDCIPMAMLRFSSQDGVLPAESSKGEIIYIQCCSQGVASARSRFPVKAINAEVNDTVADAHQMPDTLIKKNYGFVYRIPEWGKVTVYLGSKVQKEIGVQIPQFGTTERLPWFITKFNMDPETGAINQVRYP